MRVAFFDPIDWDYTVETAAQRPLGGSQSALCYLADELAQRGHVVFTLTGTICPGQYRNVTCLALRTATLPQIRDLRLDVLVILNTPSAALWLRSQLGDRPRLVMWTQHAADQPAVRELSDPASRDAHDAFVFVSDWQRNQYLRTFAIPPDRTAVLRNGVAPAFERLFSPQSGIRPHKTRPAVLAYTSTPFRGLNILVDLFPSVRAMIPGVTLKVFSSLQVYQVPQNEDQREFGDLYQTCRETEGIEYVGSVSQPELAKQLRLATALVYPNAFPETSCIAVMEAMASGCWVLTSELGALPETTAGFGRLVSVAGGWETYKQEFYQAMLDYLRDDADANCTWIEQHLREQVDFVNEQYIWKCRASQWEAWLETL